MREGKEGMKKKTWEEFRDTGLLWFINTILHVFGWTIVISIDDNENIIEAYPARTDCRGFSEESNDLGYTRITHYLKDNIDDLLKDIEEE